MDKVAVVILNWNGSGMLRRFLPGVVRHSEADGGVVCLADNGSADDSVEMVAREFPSVRIIRLAENHGFAEGYNRALLQVEAEYVVLLNSDVEVTEHWRVAQFGRGSDGTLASSFIGLYGGTSRSGSLPAQTAQLSSSRAI